MSDHRILVADVRAGRAPLELTGVEWPGGSVECRARVLHPDGPLEAGDAVAGRVLTDPGVVCDRCSEACG